MVMQVSKKVCSFCGRPIVSGTGQTVIMNDGTVYRFCSNKCKLSMLKMKRDARKLKWTKKHKGKV